MGRLMTLMPLVFGIALYQQPSALMLYWLTSNALQAGAAVLACREEISRRAPGTTRKLAPSTQRTTDHRSQLHCRGNNGSSEATPGDLCQCPTQARPETIGQRT